ncbi:MAG: M20 family metallopeptidase [Pseudomonadota bacterium]
MSGPPAHRAADRDAIIRDLSQMVRLPSVNGFGTWDANAPPEAAMADYLKHRFADLGLETGEMDVARGRRNVWGVLKETGQGPTVLLAGHMDTVGVDGYDAPFEPVIRDGKLHGRGACDMKAGFAAYLEAVRLLQGDGTALAGDVIIAGVVDEEHAMIGSRHFGDHGPHVDCAIVAEPSNLAISLAHKGQICVTIKTHGVAAHSSMPARGVNAISHMARVIAGLNDLHEDLQTRAPDPHCGLPSLNVGTIRGGANVSSVPDYCEIEVDRRTVPGETLADVLDEYRAVLDGIAAAHPDFHYELCPPDLNIDPFHTESRAPIARSIRTAIAEVTGKAPQEKAFPGSTDAPNFGCPAVICGAGALEQCHSLNEYVEIDEITAAAEIYARTIKALFAQDS